MHGLTHVLREFSRFYNEVRPHQSPAGLTPMEVWQGKSLSEAQQRHAHAHGKWVQVLDGLLVGYHTKCQRRATRGFQLEPRCPDKRGASSTSSEILLKIQAA